MTGKLFVQAMTKFLLGAALVCALLFPAAGTLHYWQAWLLICILFIPMLIAGFVMMVCCPELLRKRLNMTETEPEQKKVIAYSASCLPLHFSLPRSADDFHFGCCRLLHPLRRLDYFLPDMRFMRKYSGKMPICRGQLKCRKDRKWLIQGFTALSGIRCI